MMKRWTETTSPEKVPEVADVAINSFDCQEVDLSPEEFFQEISKADKGSQG
jgi:hypothetical protein